MLRSDVLPVRAAKTLALLLTAAYGWGAIQAGETALDGRIPINPSGGLLAKGHPIGATGVAQLTECWWQLREEAGERQVAIRSGNALQHNVGGRGSGVAVVNILTRNP